MGLIIDYANQDKGFFLQKKNKSNCNRIISNWIKLLHKTTSESNKTDSYK